MHAMPAPPHLNHITPLTNDPFPHHGGALSNYWRLPPLQLPHLIRPLPPPALSLPLLPSAPLILVLVRILPLGTTILVPGIVAIHAVSSRRRRARQSRLLALILELALGWLDPACWNNAGERNADGGSAVQVCGCGLAGEGFDEVGGEVVAIACKEVIGRSEKLYGGLLCMCVPPSAPTYPPIPTSQRNPG